MGFAIGPDAVPTGFVTEDVVVRPLRTTDDVLDHAAVMDSRVELRLWEQDDWPADEFTVAENRDDLERHERLHREGRAFTYTVMSRDRSACLGCIYLFPTDAAFLAAADVTALGADRWDDVDATVYHWVRSSSPPGFDRTMLDLVREWIATDWPVAHPVLVTSEPFAAQVRLFASTDLSLRFRIVEPDKSGPYLAYA